MYGVEIKKTYSSDFERIYPLLKEFNSPYTRENWSQIFTYKWDGIEDCIGFHLEQDGNVVGFMGLIFSCRYKEDKKYKFCNITSLIVKESCRAVTILLVRKLKDFEDTIFTGLNPINESYRLLTILGFSAYENYYKILPTVNSFFGKKCKINVYEQLDLLRKIEGETKRIVIDHMDLSCKSILFESNENHCLIIYKIIKQNYYRIPLKKIQILYVSNLTYFNENIYALLNSFKKRLGFLSALYIDKRFLDKTDFFLSLTKEVSPPRIAKNNILEEKIDIDYLYSEAVLL